MPPLDRRTVSPDDATAPDGLRIVIHEASEAEGARRWTLLLDLLLTLARQRAARVG